MPSKRDDTPGKSNIGGQRKPMIRRNVLYPLELWEQANAKVKALPSGKTLSQVLRELLAKWVSGDIDL